jgi:hypothetical protein
MGSDEVVRGCLDMTTETAECIAVTYSNISGAGFCAFFAFEGQGCSGRIVANVDCA